MMTQNRASVYCLGWFERECKDTIKRRKNECNRKIRRMKIDDDSCSRQFVKNKVKLEWETFS